MRQTTTEECEIYDLTPRLKKDFEPGDILFLTEETIEKENIIERGKQRKESDNVTW